jgi:hypothetical protein
MSIVTKEKKAEYDRRYYSRHRDEVLARCMRYYRMHHDTRHYHDVRNVTKQMRHVRYAKRSLDKLKNSNVAGMLQLMRKIDKR